MDTALAFLFNLNTFLLLCVVAVLGILWRGPFQKTPTYMLLAVLGVASVLTIRSYVSAPERIYTNASHHVLEHIGIQFQTQLTLADGQHPNRAFWDAKPGNLTLQTNTSGATKLVGRGFFEPVFVGNNDLYTLANPVFERQVSRQFTIGYGLNRSLSLKVESIDDDQTRYLLQLSNGTSTSPWDTLLFNRRIKTGLLFGTLLSKVPIDRPGLAQAQTMLDSAYLIRAQLGTKAKEDSPLYLFPSAAMLRSATSLQIDGVTIALSRHPEFSASLGPEQLFFTGLKVSRTPLYSVGALGRQMALWLETPERMYLKPTGPTGESLFLTSSIDDVINNALPAGYQLGKLRNSQNRHQFSASLFYVTGPTRQPMRFRVVSQEQTNGLINEKRAGDTLSLKTATRSSTPANRWLLRVTDLKAVNPLQFGHLALLVALLVVGSLVSVWLTPYSLYGPTRQPLRFINTELIAYILLLAFMTVRGILLWRVGTFPPTDTPANFANLSWNYYTDTILAVLLFFAFIYGWKLRGHVVSQWINRKLAQWPDTLSEKPLLAYLLPILVNVAAGPIALLERIASVFLPLLVYMVVDYNWLRQIYRNADTSVNSTAYQRLSAINWLCCFGLLGMLDAGFAIIFGLFSLLYMWLRLFTFEDHQLPGASHFGQYRYLFSWFGPPTAILLYLYALPWLIELTFRAPGPLLTIVILAFGAIVLRFLWPQEKRPRWGLPLVVGLMVVLIGSLFLFPNAVDRMLEKEARIRYRAGILIHSADELMRQEQNRFNNGANQKLLEAAQNQWLVNYFYDKGNFSLTHYARLVPHINTGSTYQTQLADLVTVRYVIAEHSEWVVWMLLALLLGWLISTVSGGKLSPASKMRAQLACLLFSIAFAVWMTATNRMVFVGQDFPLLSLNSRLTLLLSLTIFVAVIVLGTPLSSTQPLPARYEFSRFGRRSFGVLMAGLVLIATLSYYLFPFDRNTRQFDLSQTISDLQTAFGELNGPFQTFQQEQNNPGGSTRQLLRQFDTYLKGPGHTAADTLFARQPLLRSAYAAFLAQPARNRSQNLIHLRRSNEGTWEFAVNPFYYNVSSPDADQDGYQGHVLARSELPSVQLVNRSNSDQSLRISRNTPVADWFSAPGSPFSSSNLNLRLSTIPASWTTDSLPLLVLTTTQGDEHTTRSRYLVKQGGHVLESSRSDFALRLQPGDLLQFMPEGSGRLINYEVRQNDHHFLARNVWLNGRPQYVYPMRDRFLWSYHFTNLVKSAYDRDADRQHQPVRTTLDRPLTEKVTELVRDFYGSRSPRTPAERAKAFSMVVLDERGQIRLMADHKRGNTTAIDPNRMADFQPLLDALYLDPQRYDERMLFGNKCLMRMDNGPASTFKPVLYAATTSQFNLGWENLQLGAVDSQTMEAIARPNGDDYTLRYFGGKGLRFTVGRNNLTGHNNHYYLSHSTNTYNSLVLLLGSLDAAQARRTKQAFVNSSSDTPFFAKGVSDDAKRNFPLLNYGGQTYRIRQFPSWDNPNSLLGRGLWENFDLPINSAQVVSENGQHSRNLAPGLNDALIDASRSSFKLWSFPEPSHLYLIDRRTSLQNAIAQCASGAYPITTTPLKMAEMAGKLFSFNNTYKAHILADQPPITQTGFSVDASWIAPDQLSTFYAQNLFAGMHEAIQEGTAQWLRPLRDAYDGQYSFYAKTGTISGNRAAGSARDKHLLLVVSQEPLHDRQLRPSDLRNNRFRVIYVSFYSHSPGGAWDPTTAELIRKLIKEVIDSPQSSVSRL
jgi:hypothetical protein